MLELARLACLDARLLVGGNNEVFVSQGAVLPSAEMESEMRPAVRAKAGSRGKIQRSCCLAQVVSWWSPGQTVVSDSRVDAAGRAGCAPSAQMLQLNRRWSRPEGGSQARPRTGSTTGSAFYGSIREPGRKSSRLRLDAAVACSQPETSAPAICAPIARTRAA